MKIQLLFLILILTSFSTFAQKRVDRKNTFHYLAKPDSIIKKTNEGYIYITTDTSSKIYEWIIPNPDDKNVKRFYSEYIEHIKTNYAQSIHNYKLGGIPKFWNSVYKYKDHFYLYGPSDWMANTGYYISDSVIYITSSDPGDIYVITGFQIINNSSWQFEIVTYAGEKKTIHIDVMNSLLGIYTWKIIDSDNKVESTYLMQDSNLSKKLPIIVCDCGENKCILEFDFE